MGQKMNPKSQENHRWNHGFLQIQLPDFTENVSRINAVRVFHRGRIIVIPIGTLDDIEKVAADRHIMTKSQVSRLRIEDDLPR